MHCIVFSHFLLHKRRTAFPSFCCQTFDVLCVHKARIFLSLRKYFDAKHNCVVNWISNFFHWTSLCNSQWDHGGKSGFAYKKVGCVNNCEMLQWRGRKAERIFHPRLFAQISVLFICTKWVKKHCTCRKVINSQARKAFEASTRMPPTGSGQFKCFLKHFRWDLFSSACAFLFIYLFPVDLCRPEVLQLFYKTLTANLAIHCRLVDVK